MSPERFEHLLSLVAPIITKTDTNFRKAIPAEQRLMLTLRFLASGDSQISLHFQFRMGRKTVSRIIAETTYAIYTVLTREYMKVPNSSAQWKKIADDFEKIWNFPHVLGALDGKHVRIQAPNHSGSLFHNYKGYFSMVLMAICDARYNFIYASVGDFGSNNDCIALANTEVENAFENNCWGLPAAEKITGINDPTPYYLLGDEIFPLNEWLMRPYPGNKMNKLPEAEQIYNLRQSRARMPIENSYGILVARWRIFQKPIAGNYENIQNYVMACICLHNYLRLTENALYCPYGFVDVCNKSGDIKPGDWRKAVDSTEGGLRNASKIKGGRRKKNAITIRDNLKHYLQHINTVPWQTTRIRNTGPSIDTSYI